MDLSYFLKLIKRRWLLIAIVSVVAAVATFALISLKPREYYSRAQISAGITDNKQVSFDKSNALAWNEIDSRFTNFLEFLNSKEVFSMVSYKLMQMEIESKGAYKPLQYQELLKNYTQNDLTFAQNLLKTKYDSLQTLDLNDPQEHKVFEMLKAMYYDYKILGRTLQVSRITGSDYIKAEVKTHNPFLSSLLVNTFCQEAIRIHNATEMQRTEKSLSFFKEVREKKKIEFERKLDSLSKMKSGSQMVDFAVQSESHLARISSMEDAKNEEVKKVLGLRKAIANIEAQMGKGGKKIEMGGSHINTTILHLKAQIERLNDRYINSGFKDKAAADSVAMYQTRLEKHLTTLSHKVKKGSDGDDDESLKELQTKKLDYEIELAMAEAGLSTIEKNIGEGRSSLSQFVTDEANMTPLEMATGVAREEYMRTVDRYNEARNEALKNGALVRQTEVAQPADEAEPAKRVLFSAIAAISTVVLSLSILFLKAYFDNTVKSPDNFIANTGLPLMGIVYELPKNTANLEQIFFSTTSQNGQSDKFREQFRNIRYELEKSNNQILLVSSLDVEEGKSFFIASLAYSLILNYKKILIIDTNFKHNTLSEFYKGKNNFEDFLHINRPKLLSDGSTKIETDVQGPIPISEAAAEEEIIQKTGIEGLDIISCRGNNLSPSEIFHGKRFEDLLESLRFRYHYIIMEGPSINLYSDTKELSMYCDKVIGVFAANRSLKKIDKESIKYLKTIKEKYLGSVLNKVDSEDLLA